MSETRRLSSSPMIIQSSGRGFVSSSSAEPIFAVVGDVGDGTSALEAIERLRPRIAVLDIDMPGMDSLAVAGAVRERRLPAPRSSV